MTGKSYLIHTLSKDMVAGMDYALSQIVFTGKDISIGGACRCVQVSAVISNSNDDLIQFATGNEAFGGIIDTDSAKVRPKEKFKKRNEVKKFYTVNISNIFEKFAVPSTIQYISLDVEGAEERIIESFPWDAHTVLAFTIERPSKKVLEILEDENFIEVGVLGHFGDTMYLNKKAPDF